MYHILEELRDKSWLDVWAEITGDFDQIKGYTDFGDVFLINSKTNEIGILFTMENAFEPMGYTSWEKFENNVLNNPNFQEDVVRKSFIEKVKAHCGELGKDQVYIATPYPFIGGSGAPDTYKKGDVWVYLSISSQTWSQI